MPPRAVKPIDLGNGTLCASFDAETAAWLSLGTPHPAEGFVELSAQPAFDEAGRGDPEATRRHRLEMTAGSHAFLSVAVDRLPPQLIPDVSHATRPRWTARGIEVEAVASAATLRQRWRLTAAAGRDLRLSARGRLDRPALAEVTEIDPPPATGARTDVRPRGRRLTLEAPELGARATISVAGAAGTWRMGGAGAVLDVAIGPDGVQLETVLRLDVDGAQRGRPVAIGDAPRGVDPILARALAYVRGCTALATAPDERAFLTDHRLLPLSWTRDAYWQALVLLAADGRGDRQRVAEHLRWLWRRCERPDARWVRSHHADGRRKDRAFQADQQLYPFVELADFWRLTGELPSGVEWDAALREAWRATMASVDRETGLVATEETAADDPSDAPFVAATQLLLWYAAERLAELSAATGTGPDATGLRRTAAAARVAFQAAHGAARGPWAYAIDRRGERVEYHDANDLPVALAPMWGFCAPDDPGWKATMAFAFSGANPGWFDGRRPGLGSVHTPGPWTLGDIQAWLHGRATGDRAAMDGALARLREVAFHDGMLPEAYGADGELRVRHWFAWPGAAIAALLLLDARGLLKRRLGR